MRAVQESTLRDESIAELKTRLVAFGEQGIAFAKKIAKLSL